MDQYLRKVEVTSVYDGDTFTADVDLGFRVWLRKQKFRLLGVDTPELRTKDLDEKARGYAARDWLRARLEGAEVYVQSVKKGKYGRWLALLYVDGININTEIIKEGLGVPYGD